MDVPQSCLCFPSAGCPVNEGLFLHRLFFHSGFFELWRLKTGNSSKPKSLLSVEALTWGMPTWHCSYLQNAFQKLFAARHQPAVSVHTTKPPAHLQSAQVKSLMQVISGPLYVCHLPTPAKLQTKRGKGAAFLVSQADDFFHVCLWLDTQKNADTPHHTAVLCTWRVLVEKWLFHLRV